MLAGALGNPSPAGVVADIDHWREHLLDAVVRRFVGSGRGVDPGDGGIEAACLAERDREYGAVPVDRVQAEEQWDVQPRLNDGDVLQGVDVGGPGEIEDGPELALGGLRLENAGG